MENILYLSKTHIMFEIPFTSRKAHESLEIKNGQNDYCLYKIMTSAKGRYAVKPSIGKLEPFEQCKIDIVLTLMEQDVGTSTITDKFAIFAVLTSENIVDKKDIDEFIKNNQGSIQKINFTTSVNIIDAQSSQFRSGLLLQSQPHIKLLQEKEPDAFNSETFALQSVRSIDDLTSFSSAKDIPLPMGLNFKKQVSLPAMTDNELNQYLPPKLTTGLNPNITESILSKEERQKQVFDAIDEPKHDLTGQAATEFENQRLNKMISELRTENEILNVEVKAAKVF